MFTLREAVEGDSHAIRALVILGRINPTGLDWRRFIVAVAPGGEVIGCGQVKPHRDGTLEMASIVVTPAWRGMGVARAIIERLLSRHPGDLYLMCRSRLGTLYEKFGFRAIEEGEMPPYFRRINRLSSLASLLARTGETLLIMKKLGG